MPRLNRTDGFTLLEIVVVVVILGILALVVAPVLGRVVGGMGIKTEALKLAEDVRYAQHSALSEGRMFRLALDKSTGTYQVYPYDTDADPEDPKDIRKEGALDDSVKGITSSFPVDDEDISITYITYLPTGSPSQLEEMSVTLTNDSGGSVSVIVALGTGRVRVE